jgi:3-methyladenine DNA glycosylase/8-oxoguanine DNA glycosylase
MAEALLGELPLAGPGGEPVDLRRTILSHGVVDLPPMVVDEETPALELTLPVTAGRPRMLRIEPGSPGHVALRVAGGPPPPAAAAELRSRIRHVLRLDEDLSRFYAAVAGDAELSWATAGAGRLVRSLTVFEDVVKTICTTNCAWSATVRMVTALVTHLGEPAAGAALDGPRGRAFPTPQAMALAGEAFYTEVARAGYRGRYLEQLAQAVAAGDLDLESLADPELPDAEAERRLLALPGVGPYAAAHIMMMGLGRYHRLILDSWSRPKYARLVGKRAVDDAAIGRRFHRYSPWAGLAFWLFVTRDWV